MDDKEPSSLEQFRDATLGLDHLYSVMAKACQLSTSEYWSLLLIYDGTTTQAQISNQLSISRQTLNSAFRNLVAKDLIRLETAEGTLRTKLAVLTEKGKEFAENNFGHMHEAERLAWNKLAEEEQEALVRTIRIYANALNETLENK